jgi:S1-C subfamily serine protease
VAINGVGVTNRIQVTELLREFAAGQTIRLRIQRGEERIDAKVLMMPPPTEELRNLLSPPRNSERMQGEVSQRAEGFEQAIEHDTVLPPWLCGGPLVNLDGKAIGLNIARAGRVTTYALPPTLVRRVLTGLEAAAAAKAPGGS